MRATLSQSGFNFRQSAGFEADTALASSNTAISRVAFSYCCAVRKVVAFWRPSYSIPVAARSVSGSRDYIPPDAPCDFIFPYNTGYRSYAALPRPTSVEAGAIQTRTSGAWRWNIHLSPSAVRRGAAEGAAYPGEICPFAALVFLRRASSRSMTVTSYMTQIRALDVHAYATPRMTARASHSLIVKRTIFLLHLDSR